METFTFVLPLESKKLHLITEEIHYPKICYLTLFRPGTLFRYICKQSTTSSEAFKCDIWSGSTLFAYRNFYAKYNKSKNISSEPLKLQMFMFWRFHFALKLLIHKLIAGAMTKRAGPDQTAPRNNQCTGPELFSQNLGHHI